MDDDPQLFKKKGILFWKWICFFFPQVFVFSFEFATRRVLGTFSTLRALFSSYSI